MRWVIDTNQILKIPLPKAEPKLGITLAPYVTAEVLLRPDPGPMFERLLHYEIRYGLEIFDVFNRLTSLSEIDFAEFEPFIQPGDLTTEETLYIAPIVPSPIQKIRAQQIRQNNLDFCRSMSEWAIRARKRMGPRHTKAKYMSLDEALTNSEFWPEFVADCLTNGFNRRFAVSDTTTLYAAAMRNQYLSRLFRTVLFYLISWSRMWKDQTLNFDPSGKRNDWTDLTLPFYAEDGDEILTEDRKLKKAIRTVDAAGRVLASSFPPAN